MLEITPINAFFDNYLWLFRQEDSQECFIVDPGDAEPILRHLQENNLTLNGIFITHHHGDHTGGINALLEHYDIPVYGPDSANIPEVTQPLKEGMQVDALGVSFKVLEIPGHTLDHIAYFATGNDCHEVPVLFCGDTLFAGGCGRVFEGTYAMMHHSLQKLAHLPLETKVYCAHEYTMANLAFADAVTPENQALGKRIQREEEKRSLDQPTVPTSIAAELETNPFLRCDEGEIISSANQYAGAELLNSDEVFATIRRWKDSY